MGSSKVTSMAIMFQLLSWNTSSVTSMAIMFATKACKKRECTCGMKNGHAHILRNMLNVNVNM